jgi:F0F1-type ATP synthase assembly protein I
MLVTVPLVALATLAAAGVGLFTQLRPTVLLSVGIGMVLAVVVGARPFGLLTLRLLTVSTKLRSARVLRIVRRLEGADDVTLVCYDVHLAVRPRT